MQKKRSNPEWDRIARIIHHYNFRSISSFARALGVNRAENIYQIKRGNHGISRELADRISAAFPEVSKAWVLTGEGGMFLRRASDDILRQIAAVPFYGGFPRRRPPAEPDKFLYFSKDLVAGADFAVMCHTDELLPLYPRDTLVMLRRWSLHDPLLYGEIYFIITGYCAIYRRIRKSPAHPEKILLVSPNTANYDDMEIDRADITELYVLV